MDKPSPIADICTVVNAMPFFLSGFFGVLLFSQSPPIPARNTHHVAERFVGCDVGERKEFIR